MHLIGIPSLEITEYTRAESRQESGGSATSCPRINDEGSISGLGRSLVNSGLYQRWVRPALRKAAGACFVAGGALVMFGVHEKRKDHGVFVSHVSFGGDGRFVSSEGKVLKDPTGLGNALLIAGPIAITAGLAANYLAHITERDRRASESFPDHNV